MNIIEQIKAEIERLKVDYLNRSYTFVPTAMQQLLDFLDTLKEQPVEWSKEDEEMLGYVISDVNDSKQLFATKEARDLCDKEIAWLKSLRPQKKED